MGWGNRGVTTVFYIRIKLRIKDNRNTKEILRRIGGTFSSNSPNIRYEDGCPVTEMKAGNWDEEQTDKAVAAMVENIQKEINWRNDAITQENAKLQARIEQLLGQRASQIEKEDEQLRRLQGKQG